MNLQYKAFHAAINTINMGENVKNRALLIFLFVASNAHAINGNKLHELCSSDKSGDLLQTSCDAYIWGSAEGLMFGNKIAAATSKDIRIAICLPDGVTPRQLMDVARKYIFDHPERRSESASGLVFDALSGAFPCEQ